MANSIWINPQGSLGTGGGGETPSGNYVQNVNGKTGIVTLTHEDLDIDKYFISEEEFTVFKQETQLETDVRPSYNKETKEFDEALIANQETPLNQVAIRNMVIINQGEDISNIPDGTLVFVKAGE